MDSNEPFFILKLGPKGKIEIINRYPILREVYEEVQRLGSTETNANVEYHFCQILETRSARHRIFSMEEGG